MESIAMFKYSFMLSTLHRDGQTYMYIYREAALLKNYCKITSPLLHNYCVQIAGFCCNFHGVLSLTGEIREDGHPFYRFDHHQRRRYVL